MVYLGLPFLKKWWIFPWRKVTNVTNGQIVQMADVPTFDQLIAFSDQDVLGHARRVLSLAERGPHFGPSTLEFCFRIPPKNDDFCGRCLSFRNDFIWVVAQKWWLWMVKLWRFHQKESGHCIRFPAGTRRFWSLPISDPTDRQLDSIILQLWVWENK